MPAALQLLGHEKDLGGGFKVRRLLPAARRRSVGPFVFFDHFGPVTEEPGTNHDVRPHPHIGLATLSYLFEGAMMHRDSLGTAQRIEPGAINWMSAGRGIVHSERKPDDLRQQPYVNHGLQLWVALPEAAEESEASFVHTPADAIPQVQADGARVRVLVGEAFGVRSPVQPASPTLYLDVALPAGGRFELPALAPELAVYPVAGEFSLDGTAVPAQQMLVLEPGAPVRIAATGPARFVVVGGEPLGPRYMYWNFVSSSKDRILQASADWEAGRFAGVPGDDEFIPLPPTRFSPPEPMS
ncbi:MULTISPECIES: pirin family protein [Ramlibacter]|uniref:Pirin family protein n=1 Tax=Ramlibacter pinisoli TaxID=2682844 RepID=A0A6N8IQN6_9BURK|nr:MULTISPECIES: pirin family protein [Ramlibacter]MBA2963489.1 pirin family protein [Ramlibacter sp. CGMCC 1.13660]MVQ28456.1 pirin family protein [Ramlibacter pinisoli]